MSYSLGTPNLKRLRQTDGRHADAAGSTCVHRKLKLGRSGGEVRQGWRVI